MKSIHYSSEVNQINISEDKLYRIKRFNRKRKNSKDYRPKNYSFKKREKQLIKLQRKLVKKLLKSNYWSKYEKNESNWEDFYCNCCDIQLLSDKRIKEIWGYLYPDNTWDSFVYDNLDKNKLNMWEYCWY
jgi:hypothetical protein